MMLLALLLLWQDVDESRIPVQTDFQVASETVSLILPPDNPAHGANLFGDKGFARNLWIYPQPTEAPMQLPYRGDIRLVAVFNDFAFVTGTDGLVQRFNPRTLTAEGTFPPDPLHVDGAIRALVVAKDRLLAVGGAGKYVRIYDIDKKEELTPFEKAGAAVHSITLLKDNTTLVVGTAGGRILAVESRAPDRFREIASHPSPVTHVLGDGAGLIYAAFEDGWLKVFREEGGDAVRSVKAIEGPLLHQRITLAADPPQILVGGPKGRIVLLRATDFSVLAEMPVIRPGLTAIGLSNKAKLAAAAWKGGQVSIFHLGKVLSGERPSDSIVVFPFPGLDPAAFDAPAGRYGIVLDGDGRKVVRTLPGFPLQVPAGTILEPGFRAKVGEREIVLAPATAEETAARRDAFRRLLEDRGPFNLGLEVDATGAIWRTDPDGPCRHFRGGHRLLELDQKAWTPATALSFDEAKQVRMLILSNGMPTEMGAITPVRPSVAWRAARLARLFAEAGDADGYKTFRDRALKEGRPKSWTQRELMLGLKAADPAAYKSELLAELQRRGRDGPLLELLFDEKAVELTDEDVQADARLRLRRASSRAEAGKYKEAAADFEELYRRGLPEFDLKVGAARLAAGDEDGAYLWYGMHYYNGRPPLPPLYEDGTVRPPRQGSVDEPEHKALVELYRKRKR